MRGLRDLLSFEFLGLRDSRWAVQAESSTDLSWLTELVLSPSKTLRYISILLWVVSKLDILLLVSASSENVGVFPRLVRSPRSENVGVTGLSSDTAAVELSMGLNWPSEPLVVRQEKFRSWDWVVMFGLFGLSWGLLKLGRSPWGESAALCGSGNLLKRVADGALLIGVTVEAGPRPGLRLGLGVRSRGSGEARLR